MLALSTNRERQVCCSEISELHLGCWQQADPMQKRPQTVLCAFNGKKKVYSDFQRFLHHTKGICISYNTLLDE